MDCCPPPAIGSHRKCRGAAQAGSLVVQFRFEIFAPPAELAGWINIFYLIETPEPQIREIVPAYSAQLVVMARGEVVIEHSAERPLRGGEVAFNAPQLGAAPCVLRGPALVVGASLTPLGWQALANRPADLLHDTLLPAAEVCGPGPAAALAEAAREFAEGRICPDTMRDRMAAVVAAAPHPLRPDHVEVVETMTRWLASGFDPPLSELYDLVALSPRQLQRLARRYFGAPPAQVLKRVRAIRAAMLLANPALPDVLRDDMMTGYFDQAHLIRDIRRYTGRTPSQLRARTISSGLLNPRGHGQAAALLRAGEQSDG